MAMQGNATSFTLTGIKAIGQIPLLHVRSDNERAIKVYENTGFTTRKEIVLILCISKPGVALRNAATLCCFKLIVNESSFQV